MKYNKPAEILLLDLVNRDNHTDVTFDDIEFYGIKHNPDHPHIDTWRDTRIECNAVAGSPYYGTQFFTYARIDIGKYLEDYGVIRITPNNQKMISDLLPDLNERFELALRAEDIIDADLGIYVPPFAVKIKPKEYNLAWIGELTVLIADKRYEIGDLLAKNKLDGFTNIVDDQFNLSNYSQGFNFTLAKDYLKKVAVGTRDEDELADIFNGHVDEIWDIYTNKVKWNWKGSIVLYNGPVKEEYTSRKDIKNVLVVDISDDWFLGNKTGYILMHYNDEATQ
jgi:hypothetical protein